MKRKYRSDDVKVLMQQLLEAGRRQTPPVTAQELARRAGTTPETLSRMRQEGHGELALIILLASMVGLRVALVPDSTPTDRLLTGNFFDE